MDKRIIEFLLPTGILFLFFGIWLFFRNTIVSGNITLLSPLGSSQQPLPSIPPNLDIINRKNTSDTLAQYPHFPQTLTPMHDEALPIDVRAYAVMDRDTKEVLFAKNITHPYPIASVTKVMTTIVTLENAPLTLPVKISSAAASIGEATMGIDAGETYAASDLLYGAMLPSGNDAAESLAEGVGKYNRKIPTDETDGGGGRLWFLEAMNKKAQELGMFDTYFFNPTGLDEEAEENSSFSTVLDLLGLASYALENPTFTDIANTRRHVIPYKEGEHKGITLWNILQLSQSYDGIKGIKPGNSVFAKETLLSYAERNNRRIIVVLLGSTHTKDDVIAVYKRVFDER